MRSRCVLFLALFLLTAPFSLAAANDAANSVPGLDISVPLALLQDLDGSMTLGCGASEDAQTREMMRSLSRQGRRGHWEARNGEDRVAAVRRGSRFRLRAWEEDAKRLEVEMPWDIAECLFAGSAADEMEIDIAKLRKSGGFRLELGGDLSGFNLSLD